MGSFVFDACADTGLFNRGNSIKNLSRGSKVYLPVHVSGAKFSVGDLHFSREFISRIPLSAPFSERK